VLLVVLKKQKTTYCYGDDMLFDSMRRLGFGKNETVSWDQLPPRFQTNREVALLALEAYKGPDWEELPIWFRKDPEFIDSALRLGKIKYEDLSADRQRTLRECRKELALHCVRVGWVHANECPCLQDRQFLKEAIETTGLSWSKLPTVLHDDIGFARSVSRFEGKTPRKLDYWKIFLIFAAIGHSGSDSWTVTASRTTCWNVLLLPIFFLIHRSSLEPALSMMAPFFWWIRLPATNVSFCLWFSRRRPVFCNTSTTLHNSKTWIWFGRPWFVWKNSSTETRPEVFTHIPSDRPWPLSSS